ncbi:MAG TPA: hypothetical protein DDW84_00320 [Phycisphaerales bacterium]|nr:hypothetical protein [Phycisphaerales bacterium]HBR19839.1 hypothetical protein [Phycisphaerales bacterium]
MSGNSWLNDFANPPAIFRPVPFWSWNERMNPKDIRRQIDLMADAGWGGVMIHSRKGLITPYLGDEWFNAVDAAVEQCRKRDLKVWLYDEDKWPSGFSGGTVPLADKSFRMHALIARSDESATFEDAEPIGQPRDGIRIYVWTAPLGQEFFNGTCFTDHMSRRAMKKFLVEGYESYHSRYREHYGRLIVAEFTDEPCTIFRRELPVGAVPYSPELPERFEQMHGYSPIDKLYLLFSEDAGAEKFRIHYFRTVNDLFENNYSRQLGDWCAEHNIDLTGHYIIEGTLYDQQNWGSKIMPNYRHMGIPGIDHLGRHITERHTAKQCQSVVNQYGKKRMLSEMYGCCGQGLSFEDRHWIASQQMCLGVNLLNYHLSLYTMAGCRKRDFPPNIFYQQPWWPLNRLIDDSLSRTCVALSQGQYHAEALVLHPQESTFLLWQSKVSNDRQLTLLGYDEEPTIKGVKNKIEAIQSQLQSITDALLGSQRTYDFADETILADAGKVEMLNGRPVLNIGQMYYPAVILPAMATMAVSTMILLESFQNAGGVVFRCGQRSDLLDGEPSGKLTKWLDSVPEIAIDRLSAYLKSKVSPAVEAFGINSEESRMLYTHIRNLDDCSRLVYIVNLHRDMAFNAQIKFNGKFLAVYHLDTHTGQQQELISTINDDGLAVNLPFAQTQCHLLRLSPKAADKAEKPVSLLPAATSETIKMEASEWKIERLDDNAITLDYAYWREGSGEFSQKPVPVIAIQERLNRLKYNGALSLRYPVRVHKFSPERKINLVVEYPERFEICINGRPLAFKDDGYYLDFRWKKTDITGLLKEGENIIELKLNHFQYGDAKCFEDPFARYGTEIESIYLTGDFSVAGKMTQEKPVSPLWEMWKIPPVESCCIDGESLCITDNFEIKYGNCGPQGMPFYAGRLKMSSKMPQINLQADRAILELKNLDASAAQVEIDGKTVGHFVSRPFEIDITKEINQCGKVLAITLYGSLRNLLGPHHNIDGESPAVGPDSFTPWYSYEGESFPDLPDRVVKWGRDGICSKQWRDSYCIVGFGIADSINICRRRD